MPGRTNNTEAIRELERSVWTLLERVDNLRDEVKRIDAQHSKSADTLAAVVTQLAVSEGRLADVVKGLEEKDRKRWAVNLAIVGSFLTLVVNIALLFVRK